MSTLSTPSEMFHYIKTMVFQNDDVERIPHMSAEERREFMLRHVDRLLSEENTLRQQTDNMAAIFSDLFWAPEEGRQPTGNCNPLMEKAGRMHMTDDERVLCDFYLQASGLCHDLYHHYAVDITLLGMHEEPFFDPFSVQLREFLSDTPYKYLGIHLAYTMKRIGNDRMRQWKYLPAQDYLAEIWNSQHGCVITEPEMEELTPDEYIASIVQVLADVDNHMNEGEELELTLEEVSLHDEIMGRFTPAFEPKVVDAVRQLYDALNELYDARDWSGLDWRLPWKQQPQHIQSQMIDVMYLFMDKILLLRQQLGEGWLEEGSLAYDYLMSHVKYKLYGYYD